MWEVRRILEVIAKSRSKSDDRASVINILIAAEMTSQGLNLLKVGPSTFGFGLPKRRFIFSTIVSA